MPLRRVTVAAAASVLLFWGFCVAQNTGGGMTAEDLVKIALERNQDYLAARERLSEAEALMRQAGLRPVPTIEIETATGAVLGSRGESEFSAAYFHTIETAGKRSKRLAIAQKSLALAQADIKEQERQLRFAIKTRFVAVVLEELKLSTIRALRPVTEENYRLTVRRVELGDAAPLEQALLLAELNRADVQQISSAAAGESALAQLRASVGEARTESIRVTPDFQLPDRTFDLEALGETALQQRADLQILNLSEEQAAAEVDLARAEARPDITASARYTRVNSAFDQFGLSEPGTIVPLRDTDNILRVGVSIPLFTRKRAQPGEEAAQSRQVQQRLKREHLMRAICQEVEAAYRRWDGAMRSLTILRSGVIEPSQKTLAVIRESYRLGQLRLLDVLNEQRRLIDLQFSYIDAQSEAARALIELERAIGGPLP